MAFIDIKHRNRAENPKAVLRQINESAKARGTVWDSDGMKILWRSFEASGE